MSGRPVRTGHIRGLGRVGMTKGDMTKPDSQLCSLPGIETQTDVSNECGHMERNVVVARHRAAVRAAGKSVWYH